MKLLLTSAGLCNKSIANALFDLVDKSAEETKVVFIPTASNVEPGDKSWLINDLMNLKKLNFKSIEIADISAVDESIWLPALKRADVLFFEGGNTYHLMRWLNKSGLAVTLPKLLTNKVYLGLSAGSMVTNPELNLKMSQILYEDDLRETENLKGLGFVDFYFIPHLNSSWFTKLTRENIEKLAPQLDKTIYAMDDNSALKIVDGKVEVVSEGDWFLINKD